MAASVGSKIASVRLGVNVPNFGPGTNPDVLRRWALTVEGLGFDLLMMSDHIAVTPDVDAVTVVLPQPLPAGQELTLRFAYAGPANVEQWYPGHRYQAALTFNVTTNVPDEESSNPAVKYFSDALGPYPYRRIRLIKTEAAEVEDIARQWFGYRVAPASYHDEWLFEGLARYMAEMYIETGTNGAERFRDALASARTRSA